MSRTFAYCMHVPVRYSCMICYKLSPAALMIAVVSMGFFVTKFSSLGI